jgi:hypothetical protein
MDWQFVAVWFGIPALVLALLFWLAGKLPQSGSGWMFDLSDDDAKAIRDAGTIAACFAASTVIIS